MKIEILSEYLLKAEMEYTEYRVSLYIALTLASSENRVLALEMQTKVHCK